MEKGELQQGGYDRDTVGEKETITRIKGGRSTKYAAAIEKKIFLNDVSFLPFYRRSRKRNAIF